MRILPRIERRLPKRVLDELRVRPGERVIGWGSRTSAAGDVLIAVATDAALYLQAPQDRIPWDRIAKAVWQEPELAVTAVDESGRMVPTIVIRLDEPRDLPAAVHDRVTASVVVSERVDLGDERKAMMVARRSADGQIRWTVVFDAGMDPRDPELRAAADEALARLRSALGI
jgi:hypothetical protein